MSTIKHRGFSVVWLVALIAVIGIVGACYIWLKSDSDKINNMANQDSSPTQSEEKTNTIKESTAINDNSGAGITITTGDSEFGTMLFDDKGQAIYIWELEESKTAECYDDCAEAWPPVLTDGTPIATGEVSSELLGTTKRKDGTTQVTYNDHPLYYYAHEKPGEVKCHNISTHGGLWWVIQPSGDRAE